MELSKTGQELVRRAYEGLFPDREYSFDGRIKYSGKFAPYNANVVMRGKQLTFGLSREWMEVSEDIVLGLLQHLLSKLFKAKKTTDNMQLYEIFLRKVHKAAPRKEAPPDLAESFRRVNEKYFSGMMDMPNLRWGSESTSKLGSYHYGSDTVTLSTALRESRELLDYVMYHELLHKKHKYSTKNGRSIHHSREFRKDEARFEDAALMEKELEKLARRKKWKKIFSF
ncbi:M48 family peptidase [Candidatus Woesearchaeota archaeon]|nr:MAG: M48 family peptidase [Candidatus Woesearchaeota archaeon]